MIDDIPKGWAKTVLDEAGSWCSGGTPSRTKPEFFGKGIPWIKSGDLPDGPILKTEEQITELGLQNSSAKLLPAGALSMALYGATIGKLGRLTFPAATNQACANVVPDVRMIEPDYLFYYLYSERREFIEQGQGGAQPNISQEIVRSHPLWLAPLAEQRRIVARLRLLLAKADYCGLRLVKIPLILKRLRQSVLAAACSGRLTADWREEHAEMQPVSPLVRGLLKERLAKAETISQKRRLEAIIGHAEEHNSDELPDNWQYFTLEKVCESFDYGTSAKSQVTGKFPVLRMGNLQDGEIDWENLLYTSDRAEIVKYQLKPNTVLFNRTNSPELVGKTAIYRGERPAIFAGYLIRINPFDNVLLPDYLNSCLNTMYARDYCLHVKSDGVSQSNINAQKLGKFEVPLPPFPEQQEIVRRVAQLFKVADQIEIRFSKANEQVNALTQSILSKSFRGELVTPEAALAEAEGREFESAAQLLARIKSLSKPVNKNGAGPIRMRGLGARLGR